MSVIVHFFEKIVTDDKIYVTLNELNTLTSNNRLESYNNNELLTVKSIIKKDYYLHNLINKVSFKAYYHPEYDADVSGSDIVDDNESIFNESMEAITLKDSKKFTKLSKASVTVFLSDMSKLVLEKDKINSNNRTHASYKIRSLNMIDQQINNLSVSIKTEANGFMLHDLNKLIFPTFMINKTANQILTLTKGDQRFMYMFITSIVEGVTKINEHNEDPTNDLQILATADKSYPLDRSMFFDILNQIIQIDSNDITNFGHYGLTTDFDHDSFTEKSNDVFKVIRNKDTNNITDSIDYYILILNQLLVYIIPLLNGIREQIHKNGLPSFYIYVWAFILCYKNKYNQLKELAQMAVKYKDSETEKVELQTTSGGVFVVNDNDTVITFTKINSTQGKIIKNNVVYYITLSTELETGDYTISDATGADTDNILLRNANGNEATFTNPHSGEDYSSDSGTTKYLTFFYYYALSNYTSDATELSEQLLHPSLSDNTSKLFNNQITI